jgi:hypothetical protein
MTFEPSHTPDKATIVPTAVSAVSADGSDHIARTTARHTTALEARRDDLTALAEALFTAVRVSRQSADYDTLRAKFPNVEIDIDALGEPYVAFRSVHMPGWALRYYVSPIAEIWDEREQRGAIQWPSTTGADEHLSLSPTNIKRAFSRWLTDNVWSVGK